MIGLLCLGVGCVGLVLPLIPGIPFLIIGGVLLRRRRARREYGHDPSAPDTPLTLRDSTTRRGRKSVAQLSGIERLQLRFWLMCRAITSRLDGRSRTALRARLGLQRS